MARKPKAPINRPIPRASNNRNQVEEHAHRSAECSRCQALEARIAELEKAAAERGNENRSAETVLSINLPHVDFKALRLIPHGWGEGWQLRPAPARRYWMDELPHAYKCLPLVVANQWGWQILCPTDVIATWDGTEGLTGLRIEVAPQFEPAIKSQFGAGIITFSPPWLFRTPPGWNLYLKGPTNRWKPNCVPLEGVIETWWLNYTFTLNWKLVQPGYRRVPPGRKPGTDSAGASSHISKTPRRPKHLSACSNPKRPRNCSSGKKNAAKSPARETMFIISTAKPKASRNTFSASAFQPSAPSTLKKLFD